jgi:hypothetical protein
MGHERYAAKQCGRCDHSVGGITGERVSKLAGSFGYFVREWLDAVLGKPPQLR